MRKLVSTVLLGLVGLVAIGLLSLQTASAGQADVEVTKRDDDTPDLVLVADDDDDDTNDPDTNDARHQHRGQPGHRRQHEQPRHRGQPRPLPQRHPPLTRRTARRPGGRACAHGCGTSARTGRSPPG